MTTFNTITFLLFNWWSISPPLLHVGAFLSLPQSNKPLAPFTQHGNPLFQSRPYQKQRKTRLNTAIEDKDDGNHSEGYADGGDLTPLFVEAKDSSMQSGIRRSFSNLGASPSLMQSMERVRIGLLGKHDDADALSNDDRLKQIVQKGIQFQQKQTRNTASDDLSFPTMERVPGCIATVHLKTTLIRTTISDTSSSPPAKKKNDPKEYRVVLDGTADAMLSGGLLAVLADTFSSSDVTQETTISAADILNLDPDSLTTAMGLQNVLSRGRNDGMASMARVVQRQIKSLIGDEEQSSQGIADGTTDVLVVDDDRLNQLLSTASATSIESQKEGSSHKQPTVAMLLSGGVDSSVALHLLLRQNYNVTAFYLRIWLEDELAHLGECPWEDDLQVCQAVCDHAGKTGKSVQLETVSLGKEYREQVVSYTIEEAKRGRTPNPDIMCNSRVKFGCFLEYIETSGMEFDYVASGHYARLEEVVPSSTAAIQIPKKKRLFRAPDPVKDQSYFLCALTQQQLSKVIFPIGSYQKSEVRELANHFQLPNRDRPDSQGLCFLGKVKFDEFLASYLGKRPGDVVDALNGEVIGRHNGLWYHTVGQRKGIGKVMHPLATARGPWYVVAKDQKRDFVYVSNKYHEEEGFASSRSEFEVEDVRWILGEPPVEVQEEDSSLRIPSWKETRMDMKIRHGPRIVQGSLFLKDDGSVGNICLDKKDGGLAPGQYVVFYQPGTDECLGAGVISEKHWAKFLQNYSKQLKEKEAVSK